LKGKKMLSFGGKIALLEKLNFNKIGGITHPVR
jgi:hypothetical protein